MPDPQTDWFAAHAPTLQADDWFASHAAAPVGPAPMQSPADADRQPTRQEALQRAASRPDLLQPRVVIRGLQSNRGLVANAAPLALSLGAALATDGLSIPIQLGAQALAGGVGGGVRALATGEPVMRGVAQEGAGAALGAGAGAVVGKGATAIAKPIMRGALRLAAPIARKYGDLAGLALEEGIPVTEAGAQQANQLRRAASAEKRAALMSAEQSGATIPKPRVLSPAMNALVTAEEQVRAGGSPASLTDAALDRLVALSKGSSAFTPTELELARKEWNDRINAALAQSYRNPPDTPETAVLKSLLTESRDALNDVAPGYRALNQRIHNLEGLRQAVQGRVDIPATGLDDLAVPYVAATHPAAAPAVLAARAARMPAARGAIAHTLYQGGRHVAVPLGAMLTRDALLALLAGAPSSPEASH